MLSKRTTGEMSKNTSNRYFIAISCAGSAALTVNVESPKITHKTLLGGPRGRNLRGGGPPGAQSLETVFEPRLDSLRHYRQYLLIVCQSSHFYQRFLKFTRRDEPGSNKCSASLATESRSRLFTSNIDRLVTADVDIRKLGLLHHWKQTLPSV